MKIKNLKSIALVLLCTMLNINYALGDTYSVTVDQNASGNNNVHITTTTKNSSQTLTYNDVSWTFAWAGNGVPNSGSKSQCQFGTASNSCTSVTINTSGISGTITEVAVTTWGASSNDAKVEVTVGGTNFKNGDKNTVAIGTSSSAKTFTHTGKSGAIVITISQTTSKAIYVSGISVTYSTGPAYTITASSNNNSWGTVSVSGTKITATPNSGYRVMSGTDGYTVTSGPGTATVVNNGDNTFTVTPSSNCTVQINFESKGCTDHYGNDVETATETNGKFGPIYPYYKYSTRQILYTKADLGLAAGKKGIIKSIYFKYGYTSAMTSKTNVDIYMVNSDITELSTSAGHYVTVTSSDKVYSGALNGSGKDVWNEIELTPFNYDGAGNLIVVIDDNSGVCEASSSFVFNAHTTSTDYSQLSTYSDTNNADPSAAATWTGASTSNIRPSTKFCIQEQDMVACTVTFNAGTGSCGTSSLTEPSAGAGVTLPSASHSCDGWDFAGWANASVNSETTSKPTLYTAGSNYKPSSDETLYAVYKRTEGGAGTKNYTLYLDADSVSATYGTATEVTRIATASDATMAVTFKCTDVMKLSPNIQFKKSTGYFWNTTDLGEITGITVTTNANILNHIGSTEEPSSAGSGGFFKVYNSTSGAQTCSSITINFTAGSGTTYYSTTASCNPRVQATASPWVTSTKDVAVKVEVPVTATNFDDDCTLSASLSAASISAGFAIVGWGAGGKNVTADTELETSIILSYTPSAYGTTTIPTADATITFSSDYSGSGTPEYVNGTVHGRSLPQKFLIIAKTNNDGKWWAVPADMPTTQGTFAGVEVVPDNTTTPTVVPAGPASALYGLTAVYSGNYADNGQYVRFFSKGTNRMLWASTSGTGIKNDALYTGSSASHNYEWKASTTDGRAYTLTNVSNDDSDRALKYYTVESRFGYYTNGQSTLYIVPVTCDTRATIKSKDSTYNSITLEWEGDPGQTYNLFVQYGGATEKTELLVSSPVTVSGLAHDNSEYTYILSPGAIDDACRLEGTIHTKVAPINVTLSCNGEATNLGAQDNPYVLPTTGSYVADACDDWEFAGWYGSTYAENSTAPTYITQLTSTGTAYAVYKHTEGGGGSVSVAFQTHASDGSSDLSANDPYIVSEVDGTATGISSYGGSKAYAGKYGLKLGTGSAGGALDLTLSSSITTSTITVNAAKYGTDGTTLYCSVNDDDAFGSGQSLSGSLSNVTFDNGSDVTISSIKIYTSAGEKRAYISSISAGTGESYTYSTTTDCCSEVEKPEVTVVTRTTGATLSWQKQVTATNGYSVTIAEDPTKNADFGTNVTSYVIEGLGETAKYTYTVTAKGPTCTLSTSGEFATDTFKISIAEWDTCGVYLDLGDMMGATAVLENQDTQAEHVANYADSLFFSKYFEADSENKLVAIYNGTKDTINLSNYCLKRSQLNVPAGYTMELSSYGRIKPGHIAPNEEIIFIRYAQNEANSAEACASTQKGYENWYVFPNSSSEGNFLNFSGPMSIGLYSKRASKFIDVIGATTNNTGTGSLCQIYASNSVDCDDATKSFNDMAGFYTLEGDKHGTEEVETDYGLSTNRCLLIRKNTVKSGMRAIANNVYATQQECSSDIAEAFTTLSDEWSGLQVGSGTSSGETHSNTCIGMGQVGGFDYNTYYAKYDTITKDLSLDDKRQPDGTYYIHITGLSEKSCTNLRITVKDASDKTINGTWKVPIFVTNDGGESNDGNVATTDAVFTKEGEDCAQCDVVIMRNANLSVATGGKNTVRNVEVYHSGQLNIPSDQSFNIQRLIMRSKEDTVPRADMRGALNQNETTFAFDKRIKAGRWYKIALPYRCKISDVTFRNGELAHYNADWYLQTYDGDNRANGIQTGNWHIYTGEYMEPGVGYNVAIDEGILDEGNYYAELRFPMTANAEFAENATVPVGVNAWGANNSRTKGGDPVTPNHLGWNMIGNPYMLDYTTGSVTTPLTIGKLETDGITWTLNNNGLRYVVALKSTRDSYEQIAIGAGKKEMEPFMAYFVQIDGSTDREALNITFAKGQQHGRSIVRRSRAQYEEEDNTPVWCAVNITNPLNEKDETTLLISDDFTEDYDMMNDFTKMRGDKYQEYSKPVLASRNTTGDMAFNAVPDSTAAKGVPLTFYTNQAGQFTFRMDFTYGLDKIQRVEIYDNNDKQWHSLMNGDEYSFYSDHLGDNTDRFRMRVVVDRKAPQITTDLEPTESENSAPSKLLINGHVYILRGGRIYDITGKQLR